MLGSRLRLLGRRRLIGIRLLRLGRGLFGRRLRQCGAAKANDGKSYDYPHETPL